MPLRRKTEGVGGGDEPTHRGRNAAEPRSSQTAAAIARGAIASANRAGRLRCDEELWYQALASCAGRPRCARRRRHPRSRTSSKDVSSASPPITTPQGTDYDFISSPFENLTLNGQLQIQFLNGFETSVTGTDVFVLLQCFPGCLISESFANAPSGSDIPTADGFGRFTVYYGADSPFPRNQVVITNFRP